MEAPKNKGGRPTKAEQAAKGITETELKRVLLQLRRVAPTLVGDLIAQIDNKDLSLKDKIKLQIDILKMYESLLKTNKALLTNGAEAGSLDTQSPDESATATIFRLAG